MSQLTFDLLNNAKDSLVHAVHLLAWPDSTPSNKYKQALLSVSHCAELLLKERLRRINPALVLQNVDKYPSSTAWTVTVETALSRLTNIGNVQISDDDRETVIACKNLRNLIQHFEFDIQEKQAKVVLGKVLSFALTFAKQELDVELEEEFQTDNTWMLLIAEFEEFSNVHGPRLSALLLDAGLPALPCLLCGQDTVDPVFEQCILCRMWQPSENDEDDDS